MRTSFRPTSLLTFMFASPLTLSCAASTTGAAASAGGPTSAPPPAPAAAAAPPFRVVGYFPSWRGDPADIPYQLLTHVNYAFVLPTPEGGLTDLRSPARLAALVERAHAARIKVCISVGGWNDGDDGAFERLARNAGTRAAFVDALVRFVDTHRLDGVDMDWEYPDAGESGASFAALMKELAARLRPAGKLVTAAVVAQGRHGDGVLAEVFEHTDFVNVMAYDADRAEHGSHSPFSYAESSLEYWRARGLPRAKMVLGVPFYGRDPGTSYRELVARDPEAPAKDQSGSVGYNGIATIKRKTALALEQASGVMIWELTEDTRDQTSLLRAIHEVIDARRSR
jgi:chitinase